MKAVARTLVAVVLAGFTVAGCGGSSSKPSSTTNQKTTTTSTHPTPAANPGTATSPTATTGPVRASLKGATHTPTAGKSWAYTVRVTDAGGKPLSGTVDTEFTFAGLVVGHESPPLHKFTNGVLRDKVSFPASAVGHPLTVVAVVRTAAGSVALGWPVNVKK
jgi:hypothetical protein